MSLGIFRGKVSLGIFRGICPSVYSESFFINGSIDGYTSKNASIDRVLRGDIPTKFSLGIFRGVFRQTSDPRNFLGNMFPQNSVGKFRGISEERRNSEELFSRTCFVGMSSE
uniref:Uncharacterized protein n=1 Tax=Brassica oleracea var. oleracea TaxID=109376 RepID=A0A0D3CUA6_BRAOL